jgi:uncharacterized protein involved in exopolysaccharide biosynthesis
VNGLTNGNGDGSDPRERDARTFGARDASQPSLWWIGAELVRRRVVLLACVGLGAVLAAGMAMLRPPTYTTTFSFVPQASNDAARAGLATLAGQFGVSLGSVGGQAQSPQFYADLLSTREILAPIARDSFAVDTTGGRRPLTAIYEARGATPAEREDQMVGLLRRRITESSVATRTTGVITVTVRALSPVLSLQIAERLLDGVNQFNLQSRQSQAAAERRFIAARLEEGRRTLRVAEDALQRFLATNRQVTNSPQLSFQRDRLEREVSLQQQLLTGLVQQFEDARIREVRDTPVVTVIERPGLPLRADPRGRMVLVASAMSVGLLLGMAWILARAGMRRTLSAAGDDPDREEVARWLQRGAAPRAHRSADT